MWTKAGSILTLWASPDNNLNCMKKNAAKIQLTQFVMLLCSSFLLLPFLHATAEGEELNFTGTYSGEDGYSIVDVPFTLSSPAVTNIYYGAGCRKVTNTTLHIRKGDLLTLPYDEPNIDWYSIAISRDEEPLEGYPLSKGDYIARIRCRYGLDSEDPNWTLSVKTNPMNLPFVPEDQEPASMVATAPTHSTSFSGWLGLWGIPGDPENELGVNRLGHDIADYKFYSLKNGTRIKFSAAWESYTASTDAQPSEMRVKIELYRDGHTHFVTDFDLIENSGDETREITLLEDGVYRITAVGVSHINTNSDPKEYRTYTMDVILNGESVPGELLLNFQSAKWVKSQNSAKDYPYNLLINFQVKNTHNETKTIRNFAFVNAPGLKLVPDTDRWETETGERAFILAYYAIGTSTDPGCGQSQDDDWNKYCQYNRLGKDYMHDGQEMHNCIYYISDILSPYYSIPPHSKNGQTMSIPATLAEYRNFDDSIQIVGLGIQDKEVHPGLLENDGCHLHGLYFNLARGSTPARNLLLNNRFKLPVMGGRSINK
jgi:hypothetical protein